MSNKPTILAVDDDPSLKAILQIQIERAGFQAVVLEDGHETLVWLKTNQPAAILLDVMLPEIDGFTLCRQIRKDYNSAVPIIMISALEMLRYNHDIGLEAGANAILMKPYNEFQLRDILDQLIPLEPLTEDALKVLIAEDDPNLRRAFVKALRHRGIDVNEADNGETALAMAQSYKPDIIILDMNMPGISGFEAIRTIRRNPDFSDIKIVVVTGYRLDDSNDESHLADVVLQKPVSTRELSDLVQRLV